MALLNHPSAETETGHLPELVLPVELASIDVERELPDRTLEDVSHARQVSYPLLATGYIQHYLESARFVKGRAHRCDLIVQVPNLAPPPHSGPQLADLDHRSRAVAREHFCRPRLDGNWSLVKIGLLDQVGPVDVHDAFVEAATPRNQSDPVTQLVDSEPTHTLLAERQAPMHGRPLAGQPLLLSIVLSGSEPDRTNHVVAHALAVIRYGDPRWPAFRHVQQHSYVRRVGVVCVLHKLEYGEAIVSDQFVAQ